jgi:hypothetical protein
MIQRFASASAVASVLIALAAGLFRLSPFPNLESSYIVPTVWCMIPLAWGLWAMLTPKSWLPQRLPLWGAILGLIVVLFLMFVLDLPSLFRIEVYSVWIRGVGLLLPIVIYYLLWLLVRGVYRVLTAPSPTA